MQTAMLESPQDAGEAVWSSRTMRRSDLLRLISEQPRANAKTLGKLAKHPYGAIRKNVARHPNADAPTLAWLSRDRSQPLWYLVAFNPNTPLSLQRRLRDRLKRLGENQASR